MAYFAHAVIELDDRTYQRGEKVPEDLPGFEELLDGGAVSKDEYDASVDVVPAPDYVEIDGVRYVKTSDSAGSAEEQKRDA